MHSSPVMRSAVWPIIPEYSHFSYLFAKMSHQIKVLPTQVTSMADLNTLYALTLAKTLASVGYVLKHSLTIQLYCFLNIICKAV